MKLFKGIKSSFGLVGLLCVVMSMAHAESTDLDDSIESKRMSSGLVKGSGIALSSHQETQTNMEYLLIKSLDKLQSIISSEEQFSAFGAALFLDGQVKFVWYADQAQDNINQPLKGLPFIRRALQAQAESNRIVGSAVIYPVANVNGQSEQLNVELEYYNGYAQVFASEFRLDDAKNVQWGKNALQPFSSRVFLNIDRVASQ